ncbi:MFS transporter [Enemella dayhoffiae]|uniref:MFS transporter n=1 Tax=Enemella dayhoffiae TaxID=2016507 RepID=A0A255H9J5_9ACTN|nr:MFS transporter [Enemella dayhoffiae]OYO24500.1 MFS transporter [Enemella dayhoffiae]
MRAAPAGTPAASKNPSPNLNEPAQPRRLPQSLIALNVPHFRVYVLAFAFGSLGLWVQRIALDWQVLQLTHSVSAVGVSVTLQFAPVLLLGLFGGALVDRFDPRKLLILSQSFLATMAAVLAVLVFTGSASVWACYALALGSGLAAVVEQPGRLELVNRLVGRGGLRSALGLNTTAFQSAGVAGPLLAGALIHGVGLGWCFALNALTCLIVVTSYLLIRTPSRTAAAGNRTGRLSDGLRVVRRTPEIAWTIVLVAVVGVFGTSLPVLLSAMSARVFSAGVSGYGLLAGMAAAGAVIGAQLAARNRRTLRLRELTGFTALLGALVVLASTAPNLPLFAGLMVLFGIVQVLFLQSANTLVQLTAPEWVRGRVISVYVLVVIGGQALGGLISGATVDLWGPRGGMLLNGALIVLLTAVCALRMAYEAHLTLRVGVRRAPGIRIVNATRW